MSVNIRQIMIAVIALCVCFSKAHAQKGLDSARINIERVFMHEIGEYSVVIRSGNKLVTVKAEIALNPQANAEIEENRTIVEIMDDISKNENMYITFYKFHLSTRNHYGSLFSTGEMARWEKIVIHIHSVSDIDGAEYRKFHGTLQHRVSRKVTTTVIR